MMKVQYLGRTRLLGFLPMFCWLSCALGGGGSQDGGLAGVDEATRVLSVKASKGEAWDSGVVRAVAVQDSLVGDALRVHEVAVPIGKDLSAAVRLRDDLRYRLRLECSSGKVTRCSELFSAEWNGGEISAPIASRRSVKARVELRGVSQWIGKHVLECFIEDELGRVKPAQLVDNKTLHISGFEGERKMIYVKVGRVGVILVLYAPPLEFVEGEQAAFIGWKSLAKPVGFRVRCVNPEGKGLSDSRICRWRESANPFDGATVLAEAGDGGWIEGTAASNDNAGWARFVVSAPGFKAKALTLPELTNASGGEIVLVRETRKATGESSIRLRLVSGRKNACGRLLGVAVAFGRGMKPILMSQEELTRMTGSNGNFEIDAPRSLTLSGQKKEVSSVWSIHRTGGNKDLIFERVEWRDVEGVFKRDLSSPVSGFGQVNVKLPGGQPAGSALLFVMQGRNAGYSIRGLLRVARADNEGKAALWLQKSDTLLALSRDFRSYAVLDTQRGAACGWRIELKPASRVPLKFSSVKGEPVRVYQIGLTGLQVGAGFRRAGVELVAPYEMLEAAYGAWGEWALRQRPKELVLPIFSGVDTRLTFEAKGLVSGRTVGAILSGLREARSRTVLMK